MTDCRAPGWTHIPLLIRAVLEVKGPVLEFGAGHYSTAALSAICTSLGLPLTSVEADPYWANFARSLGHRVLEGRYEQNGATLLAENQRYGVVFIDHTDDDRSIDIKRFADRTELMVVHDTAADRRFPMFAHHYLDTWLEPYTSLLAHAPVAWASRLRVIEGAP